MKIAGLDHFVITTQDLNACLRFYVDILGMEADLSNGRCAVRFGGQKINIHRRKGEFQPAAKNAASGTQDFCLLLEGDLQTAYEAILASGVTPETGIVARTGAKGPIQSFYLRDPDGNLVELASYVQGGEPA